MKLPLICMLFIVATGYPVRHACILPQNTNDLARMNLKGSVRILTVDECRYNNGKVPRTEHCKHHSKLTFDARGNLMEKEEWLFTTLRERRLYSYDVLHRLDKIETRTGDGRTVGTWTLRYDAQGNPVEETFTGHDRSAQTRYVYKFDGAGNKIEMLGYNVRTDSSRFIKETYHYDPGNNLVESTSEHATENSKTTHAYVYDHKKRIARKTTHTEYEKLGHSTSTVVYIYDAAGNVVEERDANGRQPKTTITYDHHGNWTERRTVERDGAVVTSERTIEYYP